MSESTSLSDYPPSYLDQNIGYELVNTSIAFLVLDTVFITLRFVTRRASKVPFGWDDALMIPAYITCLLLCILAFVLVHHGLGRHSVVAFANEAELEYFFKLQLANTEMYLLSVAFPKLAILHLYLRIFIQKSYRTAVYSIMGIIVATAIANCIVAGMECRPFPYNWDKSIPGGFCINEEAWFRWASFPNIVTDVWILLLPLPVIWALQMSKKDKIGLTIIFAAGGVGLITSIVRFITFYQNSAFIDISYSNIKLENLTIVESSVYLIAACLPSFRHLRSYIAIKFPTSRMPTTSPTSRSAKADPKTNHLSTRGTATTIDHLSPAKHYSSSSSSNQAQLYGNFSRVHHKPRDADERYLVDSEMQDSSRSITSLGDRTDSHELDNLGDDKTIKVQHDFSITSTQHG